MYKVTLTNCFLSDYWIFEDYETATLFVKMAIDCGTAGVAATIIRVGTEENKDESLRN